MGNKQIQLKRPASTCEMSHIQDISVYRKLKTSEVEDNRVIFSIEASTQPDPVRERQFYSNIKLLTQVPDEIQEPILHQENAEERVHARPPDQSGPATPSGTIHQREESAFIKPSSSDEVRPKSFTSSTDLVSETGNPVDENSIHQDTENESAQTILSRSSKAISPPPFDFGGKVLDWSSLRSRQATYAKSLKSSKSPISDDNRMAMAFNFTPSKGTCNISAPVLTTGILLTSQDLTTSSASSEEREVDRERSDINEQVPVCEVKSVDNSIEMKADNTYSTSVSATSAAVIDSSSAKQKTEDLSAKLHVAEDVAKDEGMHSTGSSVIFQLENVNNIKTVLASSADATVKEETLSIEDDSDEVMNVTNIQVTQVKVTLDEEHVTSITVQQTLSNSSTEQSIESPDLSTSSLHETDTVLVGSAAIISTAESEFHMMHIEAKDLSEQASVGIGDDTKINQNQESSSQHVDSKKLADEMPVPASQMEPCIEEMRDTVGSILRRHATDMKIDNRIAFHFSEEPDAGFPACHAVGMDETEPIQTPVMNIQHNIEKEEDTQSATAAETEQKQADANTKQEENGVGQQREAPFPFLQRPDPPFDASSGMLHRFGLFDELGLGSDMHLPYRRPTVRQKRGHNTRKNMARRSKNSPSQTAVGDRDLTFHAVCGDRIQLINNQMTAQRPPLYYELAEVFSSRPLKPDEVFEVVVDKLHHMWHGSIHIGLTVHSPVSMTFPFYKNCYPQGSWILDGRNLVENGYSLRGDYGNNLNSAEPGDCVGVVRTKTGMVHFFFNGEEMGAAFSEVPQEVYGFVSLYGKVCQVTIGGQSGKQVNIKSCPSPPRLCHMVKKQESDRFGINLHQEKGGHYIKTVFENMPAQSAGLKNGDRIIEVNGKNVELLSEEEMIANIDMSGNNLTLLVLDSEADEFYRNKMVAISNKMLEVKVIGTPPPAGFLAEADSAVKIIGDRKEETQEYDIPGAVFVEDDPWESIIQLETIRVFNQIQSGQKGRCTVLLVDTSASMEKYWEKLKSTVTDFIQGLDRIRSEHGLQEHVSMVTFGHETCVAVYQATVYSEITDKLNQIKPRGVSPLFPGLMMSLFPVFGKGLLTAGRFTLTLHGISVPPRILLFSDGQATPANMIEGPDNLSENITERVNREMLGEVDCTLKKLVGIYCIPIGDSVNTILLEALAAMSGGKVMQSTDIRLLSQNTYNYLVAGQIARPMLDHQQTEEFDKSPVRSVVKTIYPEATDTDMEEVLDIVEGAYKAHEKKKNAAVADDDDDDSLDLSDLGSDFGEEDTHAEQTDLLPIGCRVALGPDNDHEEIQIDGGTVTGHSISREGYIFVHFDNGMKFPVRYGHDGSYDVVVDENPLKYEPGEPIKIGSKVKRGPNWCWQDQDLGADDTGTVYDTNQNGIVQVKWSNGRKGQYRHGYDGFYDVIVCDPSDPHGVKARIEEMNKRNRMADTQINNQPPSHDQTRDLTNDAEEEAVIQDERHQTALDLEDEKEDQRKENGAKPKKMPPEPLEINAAGVEQIEQDTIPGESENTFENENKRTQCDRREFVDIMCTNPLIGQSFCSQKSGEPPWGVCDNKATVPQEVQVDNELTALPMSNETTPTEHSADFRLMKDENEGFGKGSAVQSDKHEAGQQVLVCAKIKSGKVEKIKTGVNNDSVSALEAHSLACELPGHEMFKERKLALNKERDSTSPCLPSATISGNEGCVATQNVNIEMNPQSLQNSFAQDEHLISALIPTDRTNSTTIEKTVEEEEEDDKSDGQSTITDETLTLDHRNDSGDCSPVVSDRHGQATNQSELTFDSKTLDFRESSLQSSQETESLDESIELNNGEENFVAEKHSTDLEKAEIPSLQQENQILPLSYEEFAKCCTESEQVEKHLAHTDQVVRTKENFDNLTPLNQSACSSVNMSFESLLDTSSLRGSVSELSEMSSVDYGEVDYLWMWLAPSGEWHPFAEDKNHKIEKNFIRNPKSTVLVAVGQDSYRLLFGMMKMRNVQTKQVTDIKREDLTLDP